ncbi:MAG: biopolymer transporter ExbD [Pirellulaceae bacterium]|nr:biopolymer transporter ExbD [Pirellulaceae bacterium]
MSVRFKCPNCQAVRNLHPRMMGREIRCPQCEQPVAIPSQEEIDAARREREAEKKFLAAAQKIAQTGVYDSPAAKTDQTTKKRKAARPATPPPSSSSDDEIEEPIVQRRSLPHDHIDMTPMVDITFLLLIFFMSTANFTLQKSLEVPVQKDQKASTRAMQVPTSETQDSVTVQIDEFSAYLVLMPDGTDREAASKPDLMMALEEARNASGGVDPPGKLIVEAHQDCAHKAVVVALDAGSDLKFEKFQVNVVEEFN